MSYEELHPSEVLRIAQETKKLEAETRRTLAEATRTEWSTYNHIESLKYEQAEELRRGHFRFATPVGDASVARAQDELARYSTLHPGAPITLEINSPGGSVFAGFALFNDVRALSDKGHQITTHTNGLAASMGSILAQAGDIRTMGRHSFQMLHEVSTGSIGKASELQDTADLAKALTRRAASIYAERGTLSEDDFLDRMQRRDYWINAAECLELGLIDYIV